MSGYIGAMAVTTGTGVVVRDGDAYALRFDLDYAAPIAEVWSAITTPERAARWLGELRGDPSAGDKVVLVMGDGETDRADLDIIECREPHRIEVGWVFPGEGRTRLTVDLSEIDRDRTRIRMTHTGWTAKQVPGYGCGWHHFVDSLAAYLAGEDLPAFEEYYPAMLDRWRERVVAAG
jgi:uncharacterized protein YndB with AHSA1/START domain